MSTLPLLPVLLWTDALVFLLLGVGVVATVRVVRTAHLRAAWRRVGESRPGAAAATLLALFVAVGLVDSVHFRERLPGGQFNATAGTKSGSGQVVGNWSVEVRSALDWLTTGLRTRQEKTYSAPLATHLYSKESTEAADGTTSRVFPRLKFGGAHLGDPSVDWAADVASRSAMGLAGGALVWALLLLAVAVRCKDCRNGSSLRLAASAGAVLRGETDIAWNAVLITLGGVLLLAGPAWALSSHYHVFGTDKVGQDVLYLTLKSIRTGLVIGTLTTLIMLPFAVFLGIVAGYFGGWIDDVIQYLYTTLNSIPGVLLVAAAVLMMQVVIENHPDWFSTAAERADVRLLALCAILGVTSWTGLCRLLRGEALKLRELEYVQAAQAFGVPALAILWRHLVPNLFHIVLIAVVMDFSGLVLAEAVLSYVGIGVDPGTVSFGTMINAARMELARDPLVWWSLAAAFVFMFALVLAANLFSDAVRDAFDPRARVRVRTVPAARSPA